MPKNKPNPTISKIEERFDEMSKELDITLLFSDVKKIKQFYRSEIKKMLEGLKCSGYREDVKCWQDGRYGYRVKWFGQGYNQAVENINTKINKLLEEDEKEKD